MLLLRQDMDDAAAGNARERNLLSERQLLDAQRQDALRGPAQGRRQQGIVRHLRQIAPPQELHQIHGHGARRLRVQDDGGFDFVCLEPLTTCADPHDQLAGDRVVLQED